MAEGANFFSDLPADVFSLILLKLPTKSLITCISVCKTWNSILKSPEFFSSHLNRTIPEEDSDLCLLQRRTFPLSTGRDSFFLLSKDQNLSVRERIHFPYKVIYGFQAVASCNGLICVRYGWNLNLWNPVIRKFIMLYKCLNSSALEAVGLGLESRTSDYKLVTIVEELGNEVTLKVELYSVKTSSWKRLPDVEAKYDYKWNNLYRPMTYLNGALYFVASREKPRCLILGLDLSEEVFHEIMLPDCMTNRDTDFYLFTWGESLAVLWIRETVMEIWVMKEIGVQESWTQISTVRLEMKRGSFTGLVLTKDARVLLSFGSYYSYEIGRLFLHDVKSQETVEIINDRNDTFMFLGDYVESLALIDKGDDFCTHFEIESGDANDTSHDNSSRCGETK